jgi:hypothetical protein
MSVRVIFSIQLGTDFKYLKGRNDGSIVELHYDTFEWKVHRVSSTEHLIRSNKTFDLLVAVSLGLIWTTSSPSCHRGGAI